MTPPLSTTVAALIAILANGPALAQSISQYAAANAAQIVAPVAETAIAAGPSAMHITAPVSEAAITAGANAAGAGEGTEVKFAKPSTEPMATHNDGIGHFVHTTTIQPIMKMTRYVGEWIASSSDAAAIAAKNTSQWIAASSHCVVSAARDTSEWIASSSSAAVLALQDIERWAAASASAARGTSDWVAAKSSAAVSTAQDTGTWIATSSSAAVNTAIDAASHTFSGFSTMEDWSISVIKHVENHLRADPTSEFSVLLKESGFVLADVKVGVGVIPELAVTFRHEVDLTPEQLQAFKAKVDAYVSEAPGPVGYFEGLLLRRLLKAGEYSGGMRISEVHVDIFPLPGLEVFFDPFSIEEEQNKMLVDAYDMAKEEKGDLKSIEDRIAKIEAILVTQQDDKKD
jgi:hypothetical protein